MYFHGGSYNVIDTCNNIKSTNASCVISEANVLRFLCYPTFTIVQHLLIFVNFSLTLINIFLKLFSVEIM